MSAGTGDGMLGPSELDALRLRFEEARPRLQVIVDRVLKQLEAAVAEHGLQAAAISGRVKDTSSFIKKAFRKPYADPWADIHDKAGLRVTTVTAEDVDVLKDAIETSCSAVTCEDKRRALPPNLLGYLGVHIELDPGDKDLPGELCEVQLRTAAESAWADVSHHFLYKVGAEIPADLGRSIYRLLALVELFDLEVSRVRERIMRLPGYDESHLLETLEHRFLRLTAHRSDPELSTFVLHQVIGALDDTDRPNYGQMLDAFVASHRDKLVQLYRQYLTDDRHVLMSQPESLFIFERLDADRFRLQELWGMSLPERMLETLSAIWGKPINVDQ